MPSYFLGCCCDEGRAYVHLVIVFPHLLMVLAGLLAPQGRVCCLHYQPSGEVRGSQNFNYGTAHARQVCSAQVGAISHILVVKLTCVPLWRRVLLLAVVLCVLAGILQDLPVPSGFAGSRALPHFNQTFCAALRPRDSRAAGLAGWLLNLRLCTGKTVGLLIPFPDPILMTELLQIGIEQSSYVIAHKYENRG